MTDLRAQAEQLDKKWGDFLERNGLICTKSCCTEARWSGSSASIESYINTTHKERQRQRENVEHALHMEADGYQFRWGGKGGVQLNAYKLEDEDD